eukprot:9379549-Pyramimonas_sp.AAC.1
MATEKRVLPRSWRPPTNVLHVITSKQLVGVLQSTWSSVSLEVYVRNPGGRLLFIAILWILPIGMNCVMWSLPHMGWPGPAWLVISLSKQLRGN